MLLRVFHFLKHHFTFSFELRYKRDNAIEFRGKEALQVPTISPTPDLVTMEATKQEENRK